MSLIDDLLVYLRKGPSPRRSAALGGPTQTLLPLAKIYLRKRGVIPATDTHDPASRVVATAAGLHDKAP